MTRNKLSIRINNNKTVVTAPTVNNLTQQQRRGLSNRLQQLDLLIKQK